MRVTYFAYGSNMSTQRMRSRIPSWTLVGPAKLLGKRMLCNKKSRDNSGKANLVDRPGDAVWGVVYELDMAELKKLDRAEGGYERTSLEVWTEEGNPLLAQVYISNELTRDPVPYEWYKKLLIAGARQHQLPGDYLDYLSQLPSKPDPRRGEAV